MQKLISAQTFHIITLLNSGLSGALICDQTGFSSATISCVCSQPCSNHSKTSDGHPSKVIMENFNYVRCIIHMEKVDNATQATKAL